MDQTTLAGVQSALISKITALQVGGEDIFGQVFGYGEGDFAKFPAVVVTFTGGTGSEIDTHRNERIYNFVVRLYQEQSAAGKTKAEANTRMTTATDAILTALDQDKDLGGVVKNVHVVEFITDFKDRPGTWNFATFKIDCIVIVQNYQ